MDKLSDKKTMKRFLKLQGKNLGCWCYPEPCHGDIIEAFLDVLD